MFGWDFLLMLSRDSEDGMWSRFMFELLIWLQEATLARWTQSSGPLCLWQCFRICSERLLVNQSRVFSSKFWWLPSYSECGAGKPRLWGGARRRWSDHSPPGLCGEKDIAIFCPDTSNTNVDFSLQLLTTTLLWSSWKTQKWWLVTEPLFGQPVFLLKVSWSSSEGRWNYRLPP